MRLFAARAQDGAAERQNAGDIVLVQHARMVFDQPAKALFDADDLDVKIAHRGLGDAANRRIESWAIAAARQNANATGFRAWAWTISPSRGMRYSESRGYVAAPFVQAEPAGQSFHGGAMERERFMEQERFNVTYYPAARCAATHR